MKTKGHIISISSIKLKMPAHTYPIWIVDPFFYCDISIPVSIFALVAKMQFSLFFR